MDIQPDEIDIHGATGGSKWFASKGISGTGHGVVLNFIVDDESEIEPLAHAAGIANNVSMHQPAEYIGTRGDFIDSQPDL